jgi:tRNA (mo5U34)-methyltransferase
MKESRRGKDYSPELAEKGWYHSFELPGGERIEGVNEIDLLRKRYARFPIPADLAGKRVLDIGAWDGWFSFEAELRGAEVTAIDCVEIAHFLEIHQKLASRVDYRILDFYELPEAGLGRFDFVFCLGILYHLKHPLLALEIVCALTTDTAIVESFVIDADTWRKHQDDVPIMEFYETDELGNQLDNWIGPSVTCLMAMCRAAGFARMEFLHTTGYHAGVACHRKWEAIPAEANLPAPELLAVANARTFGINFSTRKEEYISCWFRTVEPTVTRGQLRLEVGEFGVPALYVRPDENGAWMANFRLPPGLAGGWSLVRLRFADSQFGDTTLRIAVDQPLRVERLELKGVCDGTNWNAHEVKASEGGFISCWVTGLPENCDRANVGVFLGEKKLLVQYVGEPDADGMRQINAALTADTGQGEQPCRVECAGVSTESRVLTVVG